MAGADDHAGQARGIEQTLFLVEIPAAVLLRHEAALQAVGEPRDDALQTGQLAVEIGPQPVQFLVIAQLGRLDHLVELVGIGLVVEVFRQVGPRAVRADGLHALAIVVRRVAVGHFLLALDVLLGIAIGLAVGDFAARIAFLRLGLALVLFVGVLVLLGRFAVVLVPVVGAAIVRRIRQGQFQMAEHVERQVLEGPLVVERVGKAVHVGADLGEDIAAHHVHARLCAVGHGFARQCLAQHQRKRGRQRHLVRLARLGDGVGRGAQFERGVEIAANAVIAVAADRFVADPLDRVVAGARDRLGRRALGVQRLVVMAQLQREAVGKAARLGRLVARQVAARQGHAKVLARLARLVSAPGHLDLRLLRERARSAGQRLLETVEGGLVGHVCLVRTSGCFGQSFPSRRRSLRCPCRSGCA